MTSETQTNVQSPSRPAIGVMNLEAVKSIYKFEMSRFFRTWIQSVISPVLSTSLYFVVFGAAIGGRITEIEGVSYGSFIVPGLIMLMILTQSVSNGSFGIFFPKFLGTIYELLSAPVSAMEIVLGYVGSAATKSLILGIIVLATAGFFVPIRIDHPIWMLFFLVSTAVAFSLLGFIIGIVVKAMDQLQTVPLLIIMPLTFLGGVFYPLSVLPPIWQTISLFNPIVYLISGFRWSFYSVADVNMLISTGATLALLAVELVIVAWIFRTGYRIKT
jgi:ABC-2 type transport system permease protein